MPIDDDLKKIEDLLDKYQLKDPTKPFDPKEMGQMQNLKDDLSRLNVNLNLPELLNKDPEIIISELKRSLEDSEKESESVKTPSPLGLAALQKAKSDLSSGVYEDLGRNDGKRIREYFKNFNTSSGQEWCAAAVSTWMKEGGVSFIPGSLGALMVGEQFRQAKRWVNKEKIKPEHLAPGNIAVWRAPKRGAGAGHIGIISSSNGYDFTSIEGNSGPKGDRVYENSHNAKDSNLVGIGLLSDTLSSEASTTSRIVKIANKLIYKYNL